jgi:hypothetical protein
MACNKHRYSPKGAIVTKKYSLGFKKYDNNGATSKIIQ